MNQNFLLVEKYRPKKIKNIVLTPKLKKVFLSIVKGGVIPNMLFTGTPGNGKTTVAKALCEELDIDYIMINGSEERNIDTLRTKIKQFASSVSFSGGIKVVILDEADYLNPQSFQPALRGFIEEFADNCRFILTCNFKNRIIEPLHSRCSVYEFNTTKKELARLASEYLVVLKNILTSEKIKFDEITLVKLIITHAPDWRRVLNECQRYGITGEINENTVVQSQTKYKELLGFLKEKSFKKMRSWVVNNIDTDAAAIFRGIYDEMSNTIVQSSIPQVILILADYQYKNAFVADHEINVVACLTEIMANVEFI